MFWETFLKLYSSLSFWAFWAAEQSVGAAEQSIGAAEQSISATEQSISAAELLEYVDPLETLEPLEFRESYSRLETESFSVLLVCTLLFGW